MVLSEGSCRTVLKLPFCVLFEGHGGRGTHRSGYFEDSSGHLISCLHVVLFSSAVNDGFIC